MMKHKNTELHYNLADNKRRRTESHSSTDQDSASGQDSDIEDYRDDKVELIAHYVWIGDAPIPDYGIYNIIDFKRKNSKHIVNVWSNKPQKIARQISDLGLSLVAFNRKINIRDISEIYEKDFDSLNARFSLSRSNLLRSAFNREMHGVYKNLPAASDLVRYAILAQEGGIYMDVDTHTQEIMPTYYLKESILVYFSQAGSLANSIIASEKNGIAVNSILNYSLMAYDKSAKAIQFPNKKSTLLDTIMEVGLHRMKYETPEELGKRYKEISEGNITSVIYGVKRSNPQMRMKGTLGVSGPDLIAEFIQDEIETLETKIDDYIFPKPNFFGQRGELNPKTASYEHRPVLDGAGKWSRFEHAYRKGRRSSV